MECLLEQGWRSGNIWIFFGRCVRRRPNRCGRGRIPIVGFSKNIFRLARGEGRFLPRLVFSPNSKIGDGCKCMDWGAYASGVWFSAPRRKHRPTNFPSSKIRKKISNKSSGATPELARGTHALPIPITDIGLNLDSEIGLGGTGDPPVSSGHRPDETKETWMLKIVPPKIPGLSHSERRVAARQQAGGLFHSAN